ncbi:MAG: PEP-CTERM/exosortase system-associated acyltransferase [Cognaticolwellia sp.]
MSDYSITRHFNQYFQIQFADTKALRQEAFKIRYGVYSHELGWEPENSLGMETDECDDYAYHCLLQHRRTGVYAGCVRLVIPPYHEPNLQLPFERNCLQSARTDIVDSTKLPRGSFGEISRLAVLSSFRRRATEKRKPYVINSMDPSIVFTEDEQRNFPNIAIGLYLASVSLAEICNHRGVFVMMDPRLNRTLCRIGLQFQQVGDPMDYHGKRAMFHLTRDNFSSNLTSELKELYDTINTELLNQLFLVPFSNSADK